MKPSPKQAKVLAYLRENDEMTLDDAIGLLGAHYHNTRFHTGNLLGRMVKRGMIERVKPGVFRLAERRTPSQEPIGGLFQ